MIILQCPINAKEPKCGYGYLAKNLLEFQKLNSLPVNLNLDKLDEGSGIAETLKSCTFCHVSQVMLLKIYIPVVKSKGSEKELQPYLVLRKPDVL